MNSPQSKHQDNMPARPLREIATEACIKNIQTLTDIGDADYNSSIRKVLMAVEQADQLRTIEENCPQILGKDKEIWLKLMRRDVPELVEGDIPEPEDPNKWYRMYKRAVRRSTRGWNADAAQLHSRLTSIRKATAERRLQSQHKDELPQLPRPDGYTPHPRKPVPPKITKTDTLRFGAGSRTKIRTPADLITKARRSAREAGIFRPGGSNLSRPTKSLTAYAAITTQTPADLAQRSGNIPTSRTPYLSNEELQRRQNAIRQRRGNAPQESEVTTNLSSTPKPTSSTPKPTVTSPNTNQPSSTANAVAPAYKVPRLSSPDSAPKQPTIKKRPAADPFLPAKRRRAN